LDLRFKLLKQSLGGTSVVHTVHIHHMLHLANVNEISNRTLVGMALGYALY